MYIVCVATELERENPLALAKTGFEFLAIKKLGIKFTEQYQIPFQHQNMTKNLSIKNTEQLASQQNYHHQSSIKVVKFDAEIKSKLCQCADS